MAVAHSSRMTPSSSPRMDSLTASTSCPCSRKAVRLNFGNPEKLNSEIVYDPDLNDGVVLNIAPPWELVPWKVAKSYWAKNRVVP